jgi:hypothetical protein
MPCIRIIVVVVFVAAVFTGCSRPAESANFDVRTIDRIAIKVRDPQRLCRSSPETMQSIESQVRKKLMQFGYVIPTRNASDLEAIREEQEFQNFQQDDDSATAVELGRVYSVPAVMFVDISAAAVESERRTFRVATYSPGEEPRYRNESKMVHTARGGVIGQLIDVQTGEVLWTHACGSRLEVPDSRNIGAALPSAAEGVATAFPNRIKRMKQIAKEAEKANK